MDKNERIKFLALILRYKTEVANVELMKNGLVDLQKLIINNCFNLSVL